MYVQTGWHTGARAFKPIGVAPQFGPLFIFLELLDCPPGSDLCGALAVGLGGGGTGGEAGAALAWKDTMNHMP